MGDVMTAWPARAQIDRKRVEWLRCQPEAAILPGTGQDVTDALSETLHVVAKRAKADGIYSKSSHLSDVRWGLRLAVDRLRQSKT